jgi:CII-binding regulator of phage lambda lysogenization HflD
VSLIQQVEQQAAQSTDDQTVSSMAIQAQQCMDAVKEDVLNVFGKSTKLDVNTLGIRLDKSSNQLAQTAHKLKCFLDKLDTLFVNILKLLSNRAVQP